MQARFYLPMYGRFASPDPARDQHFEETQSWNIYSYCQNNPVMKVDPDGKMPLAAGAIFFVPVVGEAAATAVIVTGAFVGTVYVGHKIYETWKAHDAQANPTNATPAAPPKAPLDDVLHDAKPGDGKGGPARVGPQDKPVDQYNKPGGMDQADKDFDKAAKPGTVQDKGKGVRVGEAAGEPTGTKIVVRPSSTKDPKTGAPGPPTVEVQRPTPANGPKTPDVKIRYPNP